MPPSAYTADVSNETIPVEPASTTSADTPDTGSATVTEVLATVTPSLLLHKVESSSSIFDSLMLDTEK